MTDREYMRLALRLARRGLGTTSPNPMVGAVLVKGGRIIGHGWHRAAGQPHAEIEALRDAEKRGNSAKGASLYVTLEPCCTHGRTPPCVEAIISARIGRVIAGATDPNPQHYGKGFALLKAAGLRLSSGVLASEGEQLNEAFNWWIVHKTPFVTVKAAMTLDGRIATASGQSKWITGARARAYSMGLRRQSDAILVGINTILADNPGLTVRPEPAAPRLRRIILDAQARTPLRAAVVNDALAQLTTIFVSRSAPQKRVDALRSRVRVVAAREKAGKINLDLVLQQLGSEAVTSLLVEGGGEVNASFLRHGLAHRVAFFYAPKILGGRDSRPAVGGERVRRLEDAVQLTNFRTRMLGEDLLIEAAVLRPA